MQLLVDDETLFNLEGSPNTQATIGASGTGMDISDEIAQKQMADLAVGGFSELDVVLGRPVETHVSQPRRSE